MATMQTTGGFQVIRTTKDADPKDLDDELLRIIARVSTLESVPPQKSTTTPNPTQNIFPQPSISPAQSVTDVAATAAVGVLTSYAREDHIHEGVNAYRGSVVLASPSTTLAITHGLTLLTPFSCLVLILLAGAEIATAGASYAFSTNGVTLTFGSPLAAATYTVLAMG